MKDLNGQVERTNERLEGLESKVDTTNQRLERLELRDVATNENLIRLEGETEEVRRAVVESQMRAASEAVALAGIVKDVRADILSTGQTRVNPLEERLVRVEQRLA